MAHPAYQKPRPWSRCRRSCTAKAWLAHPRHPVSTTHTITGAIIGVGAARKVSAVRWSVANNIVVAWIVTISASATIAALTYAVTGLFG